MCNFCTTIATEWNCKNNNCFQTGFSNSHNWLKDVEMLKNSNVPQSQYYLHGNFMRINLQMYSFLCIFNGDRRKCWIFKLIKTKLKYKNKLMTFISTHNLPSFFQKCEVLENILVSNKKWRLDHRKLN